MSAMSELDAVLSGRTPEELFLLRGAIDDRIRRAILPEVRIAYVSDPDEPGRMLSASLHCPKCGSEGIYEVDSATRHNYPDEVEPEQYGCVDVNISQSDPEFETLCYRCESCGSILALPDSVDVEWS